MTQAFHDNLPHVTRIYTGALVDAVVEERRIGLGDPQSDCPWWHYAGPDCAAFVISTLWDDHSVMIPTIAGNGCGTGRMTPLCNALEAVCGPARTEIVFTQVTNTGMADVLRQRGFIEEMAETPNMHLPMPDLRQALWHVTHRDHAAVILKEGLAGGWGDDGFGVYLFDDLTAAEDYRAGGGWQDADPDDLVILEILAPRSDIIPVEVNPAWPNPEDYVSVVMRPLEDMADDDDRWRPAIRQLEDAPAPDTDMAFA